PHVAMIFWGANWGNGTSTPANGTVTAAVRDNILNGPYLGNLSAYRAAFGNGSIFSSYFITNTSPGSTFTSGQVQSMVTTNVNNGTLPRPTVDSQLLYFVVTQSGSSDPSEGLNGAHSTFTDNQNNIGHYGWACNDGTIDYLTLVISHEIVEAMTDPEGTAIQVNPRNAGSWNEVSDGTSQAYSARVGGSVVQSYWLQSKKAWVVGTGAQDVNISGGFLTFSGDQIANKNDFVVVSRDPYNLMSFTTGSEQVSFSASLVNSNIQISGLTGTDVVRLEDCFGKAVQVYGGEGDDYLDLGFYTHTLNFLTGIVTFSGGNGYDRVSAYDNGRTTAATYTFDTSFGNQ